MERLRSADSEIVELPIEIDEKWLVDFTEKYGGEQYEITIKAQDWLVQPADETNSTNFIGVRLAGPIGSHHTVKGTICDASVKQTPQYYKDSRGPMVALLNAKLVYRDGAEEQLIDATNDRKDIPEEVFIEPGERLVLVRLDNAVLDRQVVLEPLNEG